MEENFYEVTAYRCSRCDTLHARDIDAYQCWRGHESNLLKLAEFKPHAIHAFREVVNTIIEKYDLGPPLEDGHDYPLFCEAVLYPLLGKDDARTVLALLRRAMEQEARP